MRKIALIAAAVSVTAVSAQAGNGYCDTRSSQDEVYRCYKTAIDTKNTQRLRMIQQIYQMESLSRNEKQRISNVENNFEQIVDNRCGNNPACIYSALQEHNIKLFQYIQENK